MTQDKTRQASQDKTRQDSNKKTTSQQKSHQTRPRQDMTRHDEIKPDKSR